MAHYLRRQQGLWVSTEIQEDKEKLNLRWHDVDLDNQFFFLKLTKSNKPRKIPMSGFVSDVLGSIKRTGEFVFANPKTSKPISDLQTPFKAACRKAGISDLRFHDLRHTAATYMVVGGIDLVTVKEILGHATIQMTMRYAHPTPENKRHAVEVLSRLFAQTTDMIRLLQKEEFQPVGETSS